MSKKGLWLIALLLPALFIGLRPGPLAASDEPSPDDRTSAIAAHIEALGSEDWSVREEATAALLAIGPPAIPALRTLRESSDPEIRSRVDWLLGTLLPPHHQVEAIRISGPPGAMVPVEWTRTAIRVGQEAQAAFLTPDGEGRKFAIEVGQEKTPPEVLLTAVTARQGFEITGPTTPGALRVVEREEWFVTDSSRDTIEIERTPGLWLVRVIRTEGIPTPSPLRTAEEVAALIDAAIAQGLAHDDPAVVADACRIAAATGRESRVPPIDEIPVAARLPAAMALGARGDASALGELHAAFGAHRNGLDRLEKHEATEVAIVITSHGSDIAIPFLLAELDESPFYWQHRTAAVLLDRLEDPAFVEAFGESILDALIDPGKIDGIPYENGMFVGLLRRLEDAMAPELFEERFTRELSIVLGEPMGAGATRVRTMLGVLHRLLRRSEIPAETWFEPVLTLLPSQVTNEVVSLCIDRRRAGGLDDASWREVWTSLLRRLAVEDVGQSFNARRALQRVEVLDDLSVDDRRLFWLEHLVVYDPAGTSVRTSIDQTLVDRFGELDDRRPSGRDDEAWIARGEAWRAKLEDLPDEAFRPAPPEEPTRLLLTIADLRVTDLGEENELVDCRTLELRPGELFTEIGPNLEDRSIHLEPYGAPHQRMYRLLHGGAINVGRPVRRNQHPYWRQLEYVVAEGRLGLTATENTGTSPFDSILYLEDVTDPEETPPEKVEDDAVPPALTASPDDDAQTAFDKLIERVLHRLPGHRYRLDTLNLIGELRIERARPILEEQFSKDGADIDLARTLLRLGEPIGRALLIQAIEDGHRLTNQILEDLLVAGVEEAVEPAFAAVTSKERRRGSPTRVLQALDQATADPAIADLIDEDRLLAALVDALSDRSLQSTAIRILRNRTGLDHGYYDSFEFTDAGERLEAQETAYRKWREWWEKVRPAEPDAGTAAPGTGSKSPRD